MGKFKIPENEWSNIVDLYKQGLVQSKIAEQYNVSIDAIKGILKRCGITHRDKPSRFSDEEANYIIELYNSGVTTVELGVMYCMSDESIRRWLNIWGVPMRHTQYTFNEHYFDTIDDQNKAYFLGLLYSDGYHNVKQNVLSITLQEEDKHILEQLNALLENNRPLKFINNHAKNPNWKNCYQMAFISPHTSMVLEKYGVVGAKSLILEFPKWLNEELYPHFIRGFFDGDGHISKAQYKYNMSIISTESFCCAVQDILTNTLGIKSTMYISNGADKPTRTLMVTKKDMCKIFFDYIYKDANLYLLRKYNVYKSKYCNDDVNNNSVNIAN